MMSGEGERRQGFGIPGWVHSDGTTCPEYVAPDGDRQWWCTTHQMFVRLLKRDPVLASDGGKEVSRWADSAMFRSETMPKDEYGRVVPKAHLLNATPDPLGSLAALNAIYTGGVKRSLSEVTDDERREALLEVRKNKLQGPLEVIQFHFLLEGVSRSFTHQIVRGRHAFYAQESLRFAVVEGENWNDRLATPPDYDWWTEEQQNRWGYAVETAQSAYGMLVDSGIPAEDARGLMPHAMTTRIHWACSLRELLYVAGVRLCTQAQFEWRSAMASVVQALRGYHADETGQEQYPCRPDAEQDALTFWGSDHWQFEAMAELLRPICYQEGACGFKAKADRSCTIRDRVDRNEALRIPSSQWAHGTQDPAVGDTITNPILPIAPAEWLTDPNAAR